MALDDPQDFQSGLANARRRLAESDAVHDADRPVIERWLRRKDGQIETSSMKTYLRRVRVASERAATPLVEFGEDDYHDLVFALRHEHDLADATVQSYENALVVFLKDMVTGEDEWPDDVERTSVDRDAIDADRMLEPADLQAMTSAARHQRDVALIEFLADTGARLSLTLSLRVGDVDLSKPPTYRPNDEASGLKGATIQDYPLIDSVGVLRAYLRGAHPRPDDPNVALFHKLRPASRGGPDDRWGDDDGGLRANAARQQLKRVAERAGVAKNVTPHGFRHLAITRMVREGYSRSQIEHRVHWTLDTAMWETYEHITGAEHNHDIFAEAGLVDGEDAPDRVRKRCGNCREAIAPHHEFCPACGTGVTAAARDEVQADRDDILADLVEATTPRGRRNLREVLDALDANEDLAQSDPS